MAGSRRRLKKTQPKIRVGTAITKKKKTNKTKLPREVTEQHTDDVQKKLNIEIQWEQEKNITFNYKANKLLLDANQGFGRNSNRNAAILKSQEEREQAGEQHFEDDDELRAGCNLERSSGRAVPPRLTPQQRKVLDGLVAAHGDDVDAMVLDTRRNAMQHSAGQLRKLLAAAQHWSGSAAERHDFRAPKKRPKKLF